MFHVIYNPVAGKKTALKNLEIVERAFRERGIGYEVHKTCDVHDAETIARRLTESGETELIVLGGDGTLHEVLNGIQDPTVCSLGLIPSGTGNDFAEKAGISLDAEEAIRTILDGEAKPTDYLEVGGVRCMNVAGLGIDVDVLERCQRGKLRGKLKYVKSLIQSLFSYKGIKVTFEKGGETLTREVLIAATCNGTQFGGGIKICPAAEIDDGKIDVVLVDCIGSVFKIVKAFMVLMKGGILEYPLTTYFRCEKVHFTTEKPCTVQLDGELYNHVDFDVEIKKGLKFFR
ncbi:MAG: diacylglycerol kinase family lipid kinase [Clostridia bacterium]|nr:diacylglycerol kinase family lipid kinase [Clostridia bacterium]